MSAFARCDGNPSQRANMWVNITTYGQRPTLPLYIHVATEVLGNPVLKVLKARLSFQRDSTQLYGGN